MRCGCASYARRTPIFRERLEPRVVLHCGPHRVRRRFTRPQHMVIGYGSLVDHGARRYPITQVAHTIQRYALVHNRIHFYQRVGEPIAQLQRRLIRPCAHTHKAHREWFPFLFTRLHAYRVAGSIVRPSKVAKKDVSKKATIVMLHRTSFHVVYAVHVVQAERPPAHGERGFNPVAFIRAFTASLAVKPSTSTSSVRDIA